MSRIVRNLILRLCYDGSGYFGWQKTAAGPSIEEELERCLQKILQKPVILQAASRTDRGVHAEGQVVNFFTENSLSTNKLLYSLNRLLSPSIRILAVTETSDGFHPTLDVLSKEYHYQLCQGSFQLPFYRHHSWHVPAPLNLQKMQAAIEFLIGEQDFSSFCNRSAKEPSNKICKIDSLELLTLPSNRVCIEIIGNHFLYKMVRNIVGTLVYVGRQRIKVEEIPKILVQRSRKTAGITAPAHGLTLKTISYPQ